MASAKVEMQATALMENLNLRLANATYPTPVTKSYSSGNVLLTVNKSADALHDKAMILIAPVSPIASGLTDALGLTQAVYTPHTISVLFDNDVSDGTAGTAEATKFAILGECLRTGMDVSEYLVDANEKGTKYLEVTDITAANLIATFGSLQWGSSASV